MARATGANALLNWGFEANYGDNFAPKYFQMPFVSSSLGGDQALIKNNLLGRGRNPQDPILDVVNDDGDIVVPVDVRNFWVWLKAAMGAPTTTAVAASLKIPFSAQPVNLSTITLNGTAWTFVSGSPTGNQIQIGVSLAATLTAAATALGASSETQTAKCNYTASATALTVTYKTTGVAGNAFTVAASATANATVPNANLIKGGYQHVFTSGASTMLSGMAEIGFPEVPSYGRNQGSLLNIIKVALAASGLLDATLSLIGQKETTFASSIAGSPTILDTIRFGQLTGQISRNGVQLAGINSGDISYNNNLSKVQVIRPDGCIDGADPGQIEVLLNIVARFQDTILIDQAQSQLPCDMGLGWSTPSGYSLTADIPRVFLPRPKRQVTGPQGIDVTYAAQAAYDSTAGYVAQFTLINDLQASDYA